MREIRPYGSEGGEAVNPPFLPLSKNRLSLPDVIRQFKTLTSKKYSDNVIHSNWMEFQKRLWQRNYFEHIIRSDKELDKIRQYIRDNPVTWPLDDENPERQHLAGYEEESNMIGDPREPRVP